MQLLNVEIGKLFVSKMNMRYAEKHPDVSDILPSIRQRGVIQPLIIRPGVYEDKPDLFGIVAGSRRRYATEIALSEGIDNGPLPCVLMEDGDDAAALEASIIENTQRLDPDEVSQWESFTRLIQKEGRTPEQIEQTFGFTALYVRRVLALGNLLPRIRTLYRKEAINAATIRHLTLATKAQQKEWLALFDDPEQHAPTGQQLKAWLFGGASISTKTAIFPLEDYKGKIVADLFGEDGYFADSDAFWQAQSEAIAAKRDAYLADGWADVEVMEPGQCFYAYEHERTPKAKGGKVIISIGHRGDVEIHEGYLTGKEAKKAQAAAARAAKAEASEAERQAAQAAKPETTSTLQTYIDLHRHAAARAVLADHPAVAFRLMVAHAITGSCLWSLRVEQQSARNDAIAESIETSAAETRFDEKRRAVLALLDFSPEAPTVTHGNGKKEGTAAIFARLLALPDADVFAVASIVMGETMETGSAVVEAVGNYLGVDMTGLWTPDDAFFDLIRDRQVANAMLREVGGKKVADGNIAEKVKTQKAIIRDHLTGENDRPKVDGWVPKWLRFPATSYTARPFVTLSRWKNVQRHFRKVPLPVEVEQPDHYAIAAE
jgi:ParB family chromosome partitioning protein